MKIIISIVVLVLTFVCTPFTAKAEGQPYQDAEMLAQATLLHNTDHYLANFYASGDGDEKGGLSMEMILDKQLYITNMSINGTNIPLPKPLGGIPVPPDGYRYVQVWIHAVDKNGNIAAQGQFNTNYLAQGSRINIKMTPKFPQVAIKLDPGMDQWGINVQLDGANGWGWSYNPDTGLLIISVDDPLTTSVAYTVTDSAGNLLAHDVALPFFQPYPGAGTGTNSVFSLSNDGGVVVLPLGDRNYNYADSLQFDSKVLRDGQTAKSKVICIPDVGNQMKLYLGMYSQTGSLGAVEVRRWTATGTMEVVPCDIETYPSGYQVLIAKKYMEKAVITVFPAKDDGDFQIYVGRTY